MEDVHSAAVLLFTLRATGIVLESEKEKHEPGVIKCIETPFSPLQRLGRLPPDEQAGALCVLAPIISV